MMRQKGKKIQADQKLKNKRAKTHPNKTNSKKQGLIRHWLNSHMKALCLVFNHHEKSNFTFSNKLSPLTVTSF